MTWSNGNTRLTYWAGVALGPAAWAINQQTAYAIAPISCSKSNFGTIALTVILVPVALAGTAISARAVRSGAATEWADAQGGAPRSFMSWVGVGTGVLFALAIANQLAASLMISPCLR